MISSRPTTRPARTLQRLASSRAWRLVACVGAAVACGRSIAADDASAKAVLRSKGLAAVNSAWITSGEARLRRCLASLDQLERRYRDAQQTAEAMLERNEQIRARLVQLEASRKSGASTPAKSPSSSPRSDSGTRSSPRLDSKMPDVTGPEDRTPLQLAMIEWISARNALLLAAWATERDSAGLSEQYRALAGDAQAAAALERLGREARLGPMRDYSRDVQRGAARAEPLLGSKLPVYRESRRYRLSLIINRQTPVTFSLAAKGQPTVLTATAADAAGIRLTAGTRARNVKIDGRTVAARDANLAEVSVGKHVLRDLPVLVLAAEAEDLGCQMAGNALGTLRLTLDERRMAVSIDSTTNGK